MTNKFIVSIAASAVSLLALAGCDNASDEAAVEVEVVEETDGMMEEAGEAADDMMEEVGDAAGDMVEDAGDAAEEMMDDAGDAVEEMTDDDEG